MQNSVTLKFRFQNFDDVTRKRSIGITVYDGNEAVNLELVAAFIEENYTVEFEAVLLYSLYDIGANKEVYIYALKPGCLRHIL